MQQELFNLFVEVVAVKKPLQEHKGEANASLLWFKGVCISYVICLLIICLQTVKFFLIDAHKDSPLLIKTKKREYGKKVKSLAYAWSGTLACNHQGL